MRQAKIYVTEKASALRTGFNLYQVRLKSGSFIMADIMNTDNLEGGTHLSKGYLFRFLFFNLIFRLKPKVPKLWFNAFW